MSLLARLLARPRVADWIIRRAQRTPYRHLPGYMGRWWLFNAYEDADGNRPRRNFLMRMLPSIRVHHILREDEGRDMHDHPWNARTFILRGWYFEDREGSEGRVLRSWRIPGDTAKLRFGEFHRITAVSRGGVWTLFITWRYRGEWGFKVDGHKVPWRKYLGDRG